MQNFMPKFAAALALAMLVWFANNLMPLSSTADGYEINEKTAVEEVRDTPSSEREIRTLRDFNNALVEIAENSSPAVVTVFSERTVRVQQGNPFDIFEEFFGFRRQMPPQERLQRGQGSGVIVSDDGLILTNHHVIANADTIMIRMINSPDRIGAVVIGSDPETDVAVLQIEKRGLPYLAMGDSDDLRVGEWVLAIGSPLSENLAHTVTQGIVSAKGRSNINLVDIEDFIQTDAAINPGNSGGPLINLDGELIGINTAIASRSGGFQGIGFAIPINMAKNVMNSLLETGRIVRGFIGIQGQDISETMARALGIDQRGGVLVSHVTDDSPAKKAGLQEEDIILEVNGQRMQGMRQFRTYIASRTPGTRVTLRINRGGELMNIPIVLGESPEDEVAGTTESNLMEQFGFSLEEFTRDRAQEYRLRDNLRGALVKDVDSASNAYRQGLREGDLIIAVNRVRISSVADFLDATSGVKSGDAVLLQIIRQNQRFYLAFDMP